MLSIRLPSWWKVQYSSELGGIRLLNWMWTLSYLCYVSCLPPYNCQLHGELPVILLDETILKFSSPKWSRNIIRHSKSAEKCNLGQSSSLISLLVDFPTWHIIGLVSRANALCKAQFYTIIKCLAKILIQCRTIVIDTISSWWQ